MTFSVDVQILCSPAPPFTAEQVERVVHAVLAGATEIQSVSTCPPQAGHTRDPQEATCCLTLVIADDDLIQELNRRYRGVDSTTDVLAFGGRPEEFVEAPESTGYLGDVIISYGRVLLQAKERCHSPARELAILVAHGILHLLGYNHSTSEQREVMWTQQEEILRRVRLSQLDAGSVPESEPAT
jgi:probable rRNA maturation factor